jgi:hypothetical protein
VAKSLERASAIFFGIAGFLIAELIIGHPIAPTAITIGAMLAIGIAFGAASRYVSQS